MSVHFLRQIDRLKRMILSLGELVQDAVDMGIAAVEKRDPKLAEQVFEMEKRTDQMEIEVEEECLHTLALHQPVAFDLRYVVSALKINADLERIADLAVNIAEQAVYMSREDRLLELPFDLPHMARLTKGMLRDALKAMVDVDTALAQKVVETDDMVDHIHETAYDRIYQAIRENPQRVEQLIHLLSVSRQLERIADHAVNIAEDVIYTSRGEIMRHRGKSKTPATPTPMG